MDVRHENTDALNAVVKIDITKEDYQPKVDKILKDYKKSANIPGFRKGHVPMGLIKRQYGKAVLVDEVNKLLQEALQNYLVEEKLDILGNPIPKPQDNLDWDTDDYQFEFELGLSPEFEIDLKPKKGIKNYQIEADEETIENQITQIRLQYGKLISHNEVEEGFTVVGKFENEAEDINNDTSFKIEDLKSKKDRKLIIGAKTNDSVTFNTKKLFDNKADIAKHLGINEEKVEDLNTDVVFTITEINEKQKAELNEEFFAKIFPNDEVKTEAEFREKLKEEAEKAFAQQSDQQLLNEVSEYLIESTDFELPSEFLKKWLRFSGEKELTEEEATAEFEKSEKGLKFQLIEGKLIKDNKLSVTADDVKNLVKERIKAQMAQFGQMDLSDEQLENFSQGAMQNEEEMRKLSEQVMNDKLLDFYKNNANLKVKKVNYKKFIDEVYK